ncbi:hypothetical protein D9756_006235 [Leucocoprinus leucothites]|uniref:Uncharacterized protein n=1 Tax=Leucocoprinus leucothites TaxID=201217 RepID=A0A8H5FXG8_9AGAR|nr:hypothetical protein D9756_006235 [Leucoagaricus leucothites]
MGSYVSLEQRLENGQAQRGFNDTQTFLRMSKELFLKNSQLNSHLKEENDILARENIEMERNNAKLEQQTRSLELILQEMRHDSHLQPHILGATGRHFYDDFGSERLVKADGGKSISSESPEWIVVPQDSGAMEHLL